MSNPVQCDVLEPRLLLSGILAGGSSAVFDFDADGVNDAVLRNIGAVDIEYDQAGADGVAINLTGDGAKFKTNTWVEVADADPGDDFDLAYAKIGTGLCYGGEQFDPIVGASSVTAASIDRLYICNGDLAYAETTEGGINRAALFNGDVNGYVATVGDIGEMSADAIRGAFVTTDGDYDGVYANIEEIVVDEITDGASIEARDIDEVIAATIDEGSMVTAYGQVEKICAGLITGQAMIDAGELGRLSAEVIEDAYVTVGGDTNRICVDYLAGSAAGTYISLGGDLDRLSAETITGGTDGSTLDISIGGDVAKLSADTITGGVDSQAFVSIGGNLARLNVGLFEGGETTAGNESLLDFSVGGDIQKICAGLINGGIGAGTGTLAVSANNIQYLRAAAVTGGDMTDGGNASVTFDVWTDLTQARIGQLIGSGSPLPIGDPSVFINVYNDFGKLVVGEMTAGTATGQDAYASIEINVFNDFGKIIAGQIDAGLADGDGATAEIRITVSHNIGLISAGTISGGIADGEDAMAGVYFDAGNDIEVIAVGEISGTRSSRRVRTPDPTVKFIAGNDIGLVMAGRIIGGEIVADGDAVAQAAVTLQAGNNIDTIIAGTITGGSAEGENALAYVKIHAGNNIGKICADRISGGQTEDGAYTYVNIVAEHDIEQMRVGTIIGSENGDPGNDPGVQIQAYNDIKDFCAQRIIAGEDGLVSILAGIDGEGNISGEDGEAGSIERMVIGMIDGDDGMINIAAGGDIEMLKVCRVVSGDDGDVNIIAGGDMTVDVRRVRSWTLEDPETGEVTDSGVSFTAGGEVNDRRNSIRDEYITEGEAEMPELMDTPEA